MVKGQESKVCKLQRSIYSPKQSSRQWYLIFHKVISIYDFRMIDEDRCIYFRKFDDKFVILSLYIDNILIAGNDKKCIIIIKRWLLMNFDIKDMGETYYILGVKIKIDRSKKLLALS